MIESDGLEPGLEELRGLVRADGSDLALIDADGDTIRLRLRIEDTTCADCVMPRPFLEDLALDILRTHPVAIIGGVLVENSFFSRPEEFLREIRERTGAPRPYRG